MYDEIIEKLKERRTQLEQLKVKLERAIGNAPAGTVRTSLSNGVPQYYLLENGRRKYLAKANRVLAERIFQADYDRRLVTLCQKELAVIDRFLSCFHPEKSEQLYGSLPDARRRLITPRVQTSESFLAEWESLAKERYQQNANPYPIPDTFVTGRGERVRSKSELIIADLLDRFNLIYFYELPLPFPDGTRAYPDFTILDPGRRKVFYWEHFGLLDDYAYTSKMGAKLNHYMKNGIYPGESLLFTVESRESPLDIAIVRRIIMERLIG